MRLLLCRTRLGLDDVDLDVAAGARNDFGKAVEHRLERGDVALEESIDIYTRGEALKARCDALLKQAEARIEKITLGADGKPTGTQPLDVGN